MEDLTVPLSGPTIILANSMYERFLRYWVFLLTEIAVKFTVKHKH